MILKFQMRADDGPSPAVEYFDGYERVAARVSVGGSPDASITIGVQKPEESHRWAPMELMAWKDNGHVDVIHAYIRTGDELFLMSDDGNTIDRLA